MVTHEPWVGDEYQAGINGQRIGIVGYSHWKNPSEPDHDGITREVVSRIIEGRESHRFFTQIRNYFGFADHRSFWNRVLFFNYVPHCIGDPEQRFDPIGDEEIDSANQRFCEILKASEPEKALVFTSKGWKTLLRSDWLLPSTLDSAGIEAALCRDPCGIYVAGGVQAMAFGLRHPQGAPGEIMAAAVKRILEFTATGM